MFKRSILGKGENPRLIYYTVYNLKIEEKNA